MLFQDLISEAKHYFPNLQIKYKNDSSLMKWLGKLLFFNPTFMNSYTTTINSTVYYPSTSFTKVRPISGSIILLHELVHIYDSQKWNKYLFTFLYLTPQILFLLAIPLLLISWKFCLFFLLIAPFPSFFRMYFEKRAYLSSLYVLYIFGKKLNFDPDLQNQKMSFIQQFKNSTHYFMWPFSLESQFNQAIEKIKAGKRPFEDSVFDMLDDLVRKF